LLGGYLQDREGDMNRYVVLIEGGYMRPALRTFGDPPPSVSYLKLSEHFADGDERLRTYYYDSAPYQSEPPTPDEKRRKAEFDKLTQSLERLPRTQVRLGKLHRHWDGIQSKYIYTQKRVDVLLAVDLVQLTCEKSVQRAVIIGTDSDFVPAIQTAKNAGAVVQLCMAPGTKATDELLRAVDEVIPFNQTLLDSIRI
jgi:uncharacterized LabA/DUF88 family protein